MATVNKKAPVKQTKSNVGMSSALTKKPGAFSARKGFVVAGLLALVGAVVVYFSFASSAAAYHYTMWQQCGVNSSDMTPSCINKSSEALVYRMYQGLLNRNPDQSGNQYWVQALAGDNISSERFVELFVTRFEVKTKLEPLATDKDFVTFMYKNFEAKEKIANSDDYWVKRLAATDKTKLTRNEVIRRFVLGDKANTVFGARFSTYIASGADKIGRATVIVYAKPGVYAEPTSTPACGSGQTIQSSVIISTGRYAKPVNKYACKADYVKSPAPQPANEVVKIACPDAYKVVKKADAAQGYIDEFTGEFHAASSTEAKARALTWEYCRKAV